MQLIIMRQDRPPRSRGDIVEIRATSSPFAPTANFVMAECSGLLLGDVDDKWGWRWEAVFGWETQSQDLATDTYRMRLYNAAASSAEGAVTLAQVTEQIEEWNGTVVGVEDGGVVFDISIYDALSSQGYFDIPVGSVVFQEISYDQGTGVHRVSADYSALQNNPTYVERYLMSQGFTLVSHQDRVVVYEGDRTVVRQKFQDELESEIAFRVANGSRYYVNEAVVAAIESAGGALRDVTPAQIQQYVKDRADG